MLIRGILKYSTRLILAGGIFSGIMIPSFASDPLYLQGLYALANDCFLTKTSESCRSALNQVEVLQRYAASEGKYPCQTRLLGLGADLIMILNKSFASRTKEENFKGVRLFCKDL